MYLTLILLLKCTFDATETIIASFHNVDTQHFHRKEMFYLTTHSYFHRCGIRLYNDIVKPVVL